MSVPTSDMAEPIRRRYILFLLFLVSMFNYIDRTIVSILQVPIKRDLGLSDAQLGALTGLSFALLYSTLSLPIARWADRTVELLAHEDQAVAPGQARDIVGASVRAVTS